MNRPELLPLALIVILWLLYARAMHKYAHMSWTHALLPWTRSRKGNPSTLSLSQRLLAEHKTMSGKADAEKQNRNMKSKHRPLRDSKS